MAQSLIEEFTENSQSIKDSLAKQNWVRQPGEPCYDPNFNNLLNIVMEDEKMVTSLKQILEHMLSIKTNPSIQRIIQGCVPRLLEHEDDFDMLIDYFKSSIPETPDDRIHCMLDHMNDKQLPSFSDEECHMARFSTDHLMRSENTRFSVKRIID